MKSHSFSFYRLFPSGAWHLSAMLGPRLVCRAYYGYTKRDALASFRAYLKTLKD